MGTRAAFLGPLAAMIMAAASASLLAGGAFAQSPGCGVPLSSTPVDHAGETPVFTAIDHDDRAFTLTRDPKTGAWALWVISRFTEQGEGIAIGTPCLVVAGAVSKLLAEGDPATIAAEPTPGEPAVEVAAVAATPPDPDVETYRVTRIDADEVLDLRTGAGTDFPSIEQIPPDATGISVGSCKSVEGYRHPWCEATWQGKQGWASACCLEGERTGQRLD
jgi:hypothetical protein